MKRFNWERGKNSLNVVVLLGSWSHKTADKIFLGGDQKKKKKPMKFFLNLYKYKNVDIYLNCCKLVISGTPLCSYRVWRVAGQIAWPQCQPTVRLSTDLIITISLSRCRANSHPGDAFKNKTTLQGSDWQQKLTKVEVSK